MAGQMRSDDLVLVNRDGINYQTEAKNIRRKPISDHEPLPYTEEDCHIFIANGKTVNIPTPDGAAVFISVNKVEVTSSPINPTAGDIIHAIFDWDNTNERKQDWFSDILQFGLNSVTGARNQLKNGKHAFYYMEANPEKIKNLNVSNVKSMLKIFSFATVFDQDIARWDVSGVTDARSMFHGADSFNKNIRRWDVSSVEDMSAMFRNALSFDQPIGDWNVSNVTNMNQTFLGTPSFNQPIGDWDVSNVINMNDMFQSSSFNQDISKWNTSNVEKMFQMFSWNVSFNQDLSQWCVSQFDVMPLDFDKNATGWTLPKPVWGSCPRGENMDDILPGGYTIKDCHIFVANGKTVKIPTPNGAAIFVSVNHVEVTSSPINPAAGDIIHAIFDWNNKNSKKQDWFSDILQFGLNSVTGARNQLKDGKYAFYYMEANPEIIKDLDVSNVQSMLRCLSFTTSFNQDIGNWDVSNVPDTRSMFYGAEAFNQDIGGWDVSSVTDMNSMFRDMSSPFNQPLGAWNVSNVGNMNNMFNGTASFNQDLSQWCVTKIGIKPDGFDKDCTGWNNNNEKPCWGHCPRGENGVVDPCPTPDPNARPWDDYDIIYHVIVTDPADINVDGSDSIYNKDTLEKVASINAPGEWIIGTESVTRVGGVRFSGSSGTWEFGELTDVSKSTNMMNMFENCTNFNGDVSGFDTGNVTDMTAMFAECSAFNQDISGWDTHSLQVAMYTFRNASNFNQDLSGWCVPLMSGPYSHVAFMDGAGPLAKEPVWGTCPDPGTPVDFVPLPDGVTLNLPKDMVVNKHSRGAGIIPHDPWITIDIRTSINTDDYLFCMCWPHFSGQGGDGISGPNSDREMARLGYTIDYRGNKAYTGCLYSYRAEYDGINTKWHPFEVFSKPFGFSWDIGNHLSFVPTIKKLDVAKCQPYIIAYPKTHLNITTHREVIELNGEEPSVGATANVPEGSYFIYDYYDAQQHWIVKDGLWQFGKSFKDARFNEWTDEKHAEMLDLAPMMVDITDWNFARVEKQ